MSSYNSPFPVYFKNNLSADSPVVGYVTYNPNSYFYSFKPSRVDLEPVSSRDYNLVCQYLKANNLAVFDYTQTSFGKFLLQNS